MRNHTFNRRTAGKKDIFVILTRQAWLALTVLTIAGHVLAGDLESYKAKYEEDFASIVQKHEIALMDLEQYYVKILDDLTAAYQKKTDLEGVLLIEGEKKRFVKERNIPARDSRSSQPALRRLQASYAAKLDDMEVKKAKRILILVEQYDKTLELLQSDYTKQLKIDQATLVKNERDRVGNSQDVLSATLKVEELTQQSEPNRPAERDKKPKAPATPSEIPREIASRLVLHYSFDSKGRKTITDKSRKNNNGSVHGPTYQQDGRIHGAYEFDGQDDYIEADRSENLDVTKEVTIAAFANVREFLMHGGIVCYGPDDNGPETYSLNTYADPDRVAFRSNWPLMWYNLPLRTQLKRETWYHFAATFKNGEAKLYLNGEEENSQTWNLPELPLAPNRKLRIGENQPGSDDYFAGLIDEVMIFDKALSPAEIKQLYDILSAR